MERSTDEVFTDTLAEGVDMVRCVCKERLKFEVEYGMRRGTTDNSYVVKGDEATALLDLPDKSFAPAFSKVVDSGTIDFYRPRSPLPQALGRSGARCSWHDPSAPRR